MRVGSARSRVSFLFMLGLAMSGRGPWARLRFAGLCAGAIVLCLGLSGLAGTVALAEDRAARADSIRPTLTDNLGEALLLISFDGFTEFDDRGVVVQSIWPLVADAPLPPGVTAWPEPGEAVLSPAVHEALADIDPEFFGPVAGVIARDGLETPSERRVYLRPATAIVDQGSMHGATGFGNHAGDGWYGLGELNAAPTYGIVLLFLSTMIVPGAATVALGAGLDRQRRLTRHRQLVVFGARRLDRSLVNAGEAVPAITSGTVIAAGIVGLGALFGLQLPALDTVVPAVEVRRHLPLLAGMLVFGFIAGMIIAVVVHPRTRIRPRRWRRAASVVGESNVPTARAVSGLLIGVGTILIPPLTTSGPLRTIIYSAGAALFALCLPALIAVILKIIGDGVASLAARRGSVGGLLGGRRLGVFPGRTARLCLGVAGTILIVGQVQLWSAQLGRQYFDSVALREQYGTSLLTTSVSQVTAGVEQFVTTSGDDALMIWAWMEVGEDGSPHDVLGAACETWQELSLPCEVQTLRTEQMASVPPVLRRVTESLGDDSGIAVRTLTTSAPTLSTDANSLSLILISPDGSDLPRIELERASYRFVHGGLHLQSPWQGWLIAGAVTKAAGSWAGAWGALGVLGMLIATALTLAGDVIASARDVAPLAALSGRSRWLMVLSFWRLGLPITVAALVGAVGYYFLPSGLQAGENVMVPSLAFATACVTSGIAVAVLMTGVTGRFLTTTAHQWRPGESDYTTV